ncbi:hypothetical protein LEP1GSC163_3628 [Leptospira santarosai str. CBC379]|nr:hypothetical protein LEP1GSC163_3628 [Leptospira santarosai str. CBC379]EMM85610.1 hypothetical protein LEP1GSC039_1735 [Leptospira santarosai str. 2000027870]
MPSFSKDHPAGFGTGCKLNFPSNEAPNNSYPKIQWEKFFLDFIKILKVKNE